MRRALVASLVVVLSMGAICGGPHRTSFKMALPDDWNGTALTPDDCNAMCGDHGGVRKVYGCTTDLKNRQISCDVEKEGPG